MHDTPETLETVEHHTPAYAMVPEWAIFSQRLTSSQYRVYTILCLYANKYDQAWPKVETLAAKAGITHQAISKTIRELAALGLVRIAKQGFPARNRYFIYRDSQPPASWTEGEDAQTQLLVETDETASSCNPTLHQLQPVVARVATPRLQEQQTIRTDHKNIISQESNNSNSLAPEAPPERRTRERVIRPAMERDPLFSALANELHTRPVTRHEWGQWAKCINDLREVEATPGQVTAAVRAFHRLYPQAHCTVFALLKNWGTLTLREGMYGTTPVKTATEVEAEHAAAQAEHERRQREWTAFEAQLVADGIVRPPLRD